MEDIMEVDKSEFDANYRKRTKQSILDEINWRLERINYKVQGAIENEIIENDSAVKLKIEDINKFSGKKRIKSDEFLSPAKNLNKKALIRYATELRIAEKNEIWTNEGQIKLEQQYIKARDTLVERYDLKNLSEEEYHTIVSTMNQYKEELSTHYDSRQFIADVSELSDLHKVEIGDILKKTIKDVKGKAFTKSKFRENFIKNLREAYDTK